MRKRATLVLSAAMFGGLALCANPALATDATSRLTLDGPLLLVGVGLGDASAQAFHCPTHDAALCLVAPVLDFGALSAGWLRWSLASLPAPVTHNAPPTTPVTRPPPALGGQLQFGQGRELSVQITPTPRRCAPLVKLTF